jgi:hypothetical protein
MKKINNQYFANVVKEMKIRGRGPGEEKKEMWECVKGREK